MPLFSKIYFNVWALRFSILPPRLTIGVLVPTGYLSRRSLICSDEGLTLQTAAVIRFPAVTRLTSSGVSLGVQTRECDKSTLFLSRES